MPDRAFHGPPASRIRQCILVAQVSDADLPSEARPAVGCVTCSHDEQPTLRVCDRLRSTRPAVQREELLAASTFRGAQPLSSFCGTGHASRDPSAHLWRKSVPRAPVLVVCETAK